MTEPQKIVLAQVSKNRKTGQSRRIGVPMSIALPLPVLIERRIPSAGRARN